MDAGTHRKEGGTIRGGILPGSALSSEKIFASHPLPSAAHILGKTASLLACENLQARP